MRGQRYLDCARLNLQALRLLALRRWVRSSDVARSYSQLAVDYDRTWLVHLQEVTQHLIDCLPTVLPEGSFIDLGCGTGYAARHLTECYPKRAVDACDLSEGMITEARSRAGSGDIRWHVADMLSYLSSCPPDSTSLIVATWSVGYSDFRLICREAHRVLVSGGYFAFVVNLADTLAPLRRAFRYCMQAHASELKSLTHLSFPHSLESLQNSLQKARLDIEHSEEGNCLIEPQPSPDGRMLPWLLRTGTLAGYDTMLPLDTPGPVSDTFEARLAADPESIQHHYALAISVKP